VRRAAVVYNPVSGAGRAEALSREAQERLQDAGFEVERLATRPEGGALEVVRGLKPGLELLVVAGGDGSIREAVEALGPDAPVQLAILPLGNANVVARELGISTDPRQAMRLLTEGTSTRVDLGTANGRPFLAMAGAGWDAATLESMARLRGTRSGRALYRWLPDLVYLVLGLGAYARDRGRRASRLLLRADGRARVRVYRGVVVANFRTYAKGWSMVPAAHFQSGTLHFQGRRRSVLPAMLWHLAAAVLERPSPSFISDYGEGDVLRLESEYPFPLQLDGDFLERTSRVDLRVEPAALSVLVPLAASAKLAGRPLPELAKVAVAPR